jgi:hypothetical protein
LTATDVATTAVTLGGSAIKGIGKKAIVSEGLEAAEDARLGSGNPCSIGGSFDQATLVRTAEGLVPISEIKIGDLVLSGDESTGSTDWKQVENVLGHTHNSFVRLYVQETNGSTEQIVTTLEHPFWIEGLGWTPAGKITDSARIRTTNGWLSVSSVKHITGKIRTVDLSVAGLHTFYVGQSGVWVHNAKGPCDLFERPYSNLPDSPSVGPGKNFTPTQKRNILEQNMKANGGVLRSDVTGELLVPPKKSRGGVAPRPNEAQIDHIDTKVPSDPNAKPGSNSHSNAQVLSREENRLKSND